MPERVPHRTRFGYRLTQWLVRTIFKVLYGLKIEGASNVPRQGGFILACNHQSWFDPPIVGSSCPREIFYAAKKQLFITPILGTLVKYYNSIPVNRTGFDRFALTELGRRLDQGFGIIVFPEGTRFSDGKLHPGKPGVGLLAVERQTMIVPAYIQGSACLLRQIFNRHLLLKFGEPFPAPSILDSNLDRKEAARLTAVMVMKQIAKLGKVMAPEEMTKP